MIRCSTTDIYCIALFAIEQLIYNRFYAREAKNAVFSDYFDACLVRFCEKTHAKTFRSRYFALATFGYYFFA